MTSKFTIIGTDTKITFEWTAPTVLIQTIVGACAEYLWNHGYGDHTGTPMAPATETTPEVPAVEATFASLTNIQKLALVEAHLKQVIINLSNNFKETKATKATLVLEEETKYEL